MAATKNIFITQGISYSLTMGAINESNTFLGITSGSGYTAEGQLRRSYFSTEAVNFDVSIPSAGVINVALGVTATAALKHGVYVWDVQLTFPDGKVVRQKQGNAYIDR